MPLTRYQIRSEGRLADPELYRTTDKDDPEGILEGVAMASLVGVLRQLGDLAQFAAEIFNDLHEEVMSTSSRGHGLMSRVKQLEADFPSIQKSFLSQTDHSKFYYNKGVDSHINLRMNQNLVTRGDLPRFIMDSYEECRGPPRLFLLDKFDMAGAGACLKRYTDPSFFKVETTPCVVKETEVQGDKKNQRFKKKRSLWKNGGAGLESVPTSHAKLHELLDEERTQNVVTEPANHIMLKRRQHLNGCRLDSITGKSYMERFLESYSCEEEVTMSTPSISREQLEIQKTAHSSPHLQELSPRLTREEGMNGFATGGEVLRVLDAESAAKNYGSISMDDYQSDDVSSGVGNYVDALPIMESEMYSDSEYGNKYKYDSCFEKHEMAPDSNGVHRKFYHSGSTANSSISDGNNSFKKGMPSSSYSDTSSNPADNVFSDGDGPAAVFPTVYTSSNLIPVRETISGNGTPDPDDSLSVKEVLSDYTKQCTGFSNLVEHTTPGVSDAPSGDILIPVISDEVHLVDAMRDSANSVSVSPSSEMIGSPSLNPSDIQSTVSNPDKSCKKDLGMDDTLSLSSFEESENLKEVKLIGGAPNDLSLVLCNAASSEDEIPNFPLDQSVDLDCLALSKDKFPENAIVEVNEIVDVECLSLTDHSLNTALMDQNGCSDSNVPPSEPCSESGPGPSGFGSREEAQFSGEEIERCYESRNPLEPIPSNPVQFPNVEETPPLPPLPPMQWRLGKPLQDLKPSKSSEMGDAYNEVCYQEEEQKDNNSEIVFTDSVENLILPCPPESPLPILVNNLELPLPTAISNHELRLPTAVNNLNLPMPTMVNKDDDTSHDFETYEESLPLNPSISLHGNVIPDSENPSPLSPAQINESTTIGVATPLNQGFIKDLKQIELDTEKQEAGFLCGEGDDTGNSPLKFVPLPSTKDGQTHFDLYPVSEDEIPNEKPLRRVPRPPDPLIKAVAAHDRTKLKKVSERVRREIEPRVEQRDSVLEQIRSKSFNLKPAAVARPNIQGPTTNLKVAAILEKANAIRQAYAGSDEEDDDDNWSQC